VRTSIDYPSLVRDIRQARGLTQEQLAREVGVTFSTVNGWENGRHQPIPALASRLVAMADEAGIRRPLRSSPKERARAGRGHTPGART
jgi:transcriptional regulator with XRE-family HTH domain